MSFQYADSKGEIIKGNTLQEKIANAKTPGEIQALLHPGKDTSSSSHFDGYRSSAASAPAPAKVQSASSNSADANKCWRVIYPHGNDRYELNGATEEELDQKEAAIRAMY